MTFKYLATAFAIAAGLGSSAAQANTRPASSHPPTAHIQTQPDRVYLSPRYLDLCARAPVECAPYSARGQFVKLSPGVLESLHSVNRKVNRSIRYASDTRNYGHIDYWNLPSAGTGDCEDYALAKRRELISRGWPRSSLLLAVAYSETGTGHAVLIARTDQGDFVLDNRRRNALPWHKLPYKWVSIQSADNPKHFAYINTQRVPDPA